MPSHLELDRTPERDHTIAPPSDGAVATPKDADTLATYHPAHRALEIVSITAFFTLSAWLFSRLFAASTGNDWMIIVAGAFAGYVCSDFTSGLVHWGFDTWGSIYTPVLGAAFIRPFREHHFDQKAITRHDFVETNGNNCLVSLPVLGLAFLVPAQHGDSFGLFAVTVILFICIGTLGTNQFHKWSHLDNPPASVKLLQKWHVVLPIDHHAIHHTAPFDTHYCITTGWLNPLLRATRFYRHLETVVTAVTGAEPRKDDLA